MIRSWRHVSLLPALFVFTLVFAEPLFAVPVGCVGGAGEESVVPLSAQPTKESVEWSFQVASKESGVPEAILKAIAYLESGWMQIGPTCDYGYGIMHLTDNSYTQTLKEAAAVSGYSEELLKQDAQANIRAAAALIAKYVKETVGEAKSLEDYFEALKKFSGLFNEELQEKQALEYYRILRDGVDGTNGLGWEISLASNEVDVSSKVTTEPEMHSTDYPPALWRQAYYYSSRSGTAIDRWVNHWIGLGTYSGTVDFFARANGRSVSAHFVARSSDGELTQMVRFADKAWHCSTWNSRSIGIEHEATTSHPEYWNSHPMLQASAAACKFVCEKYSFPKTRAYIVGHKEVPNAATACPGNLPWNTYMDYVVGPVDPKYTNSLTNGGFENDMDSWTTGSNTTTSIVTDDVHGGSKACKLFRADAGYATIWQNAYESSGQAWRASCYAKVVPGMTGTKFGFKDVNGVDRAPVDISSNSWAYYTVDYTVAADVDVQVWGNGSSGILIDDVRCGPVNRMNWINTWLWNGTHAESLGTDYFAADGGEANIAPSAGQTDGGRKWQSVQTQDGFLRLLDYTGTGATYCSSYAFVYVRTGSTKSNVNLIVGSDDGLKVWLNGRLVHTNDVDRGHDYLAPDQDVIESLTLHPGDNKLLIKVRQKTGGHSLSARFADKDGNAVSGLTYALSGSGVVVPDIIVESKPGGHNNNCYSETGQFADASTDCGASGCTGGIGMRYGSTYRSVAGAKAAKFCPNIPTAGRYNVYCAWGAGNLRRNPITYKVFHAGGESEYHVDQSASADSWTSLGRHVFAKGSTGFVEMSNEDIDLSGNMYAGAVKFEFVETVADTPTPEPTATRTPAPTPTDPVATEGNWFMFR